MKTNKKTPRPNKQKKEPTCNSPGHCSRSCAEDAWKYFTRHWRQNSFFTCSGKRAAQRESRAAQIFYGWIGSHWSCYQATHASPGRGKQLAGFEDLRVYEPNAGPIYGKGQPSVSVGAPPQVAPDQALVGRSLLADAVSYGDQDIIQYLATGTQFSHQLVEETLSRQSGWQVLGTPAESNSIMCVLRSWETWSTVLWLVKSSTLSVTVVEVSLSKTGLWLLHTHLTNDFIVIQW